MKRFWEIVLLIIFFIPLILIYPTRIVGKRNIRRKGRVILCTNHQSSVDPIVIWSRIFRRRFNFMAKEELFHNKFFGYICKCLRAYPVNRNTTDIKSIKTTMDMLRREKAVCIFPEGTRLKSDESNELKSGVIIFALKTDSPIVPAYIKKKFRPFCFNKMVVGQEFWLSKELGYVKGDKITPELIEEGTKLLSKKIYELKER